MVLFAVALSWPLAVDLTPASARPWVGGSPTNSVLQLALGYNGLGRVTGQEGAGAPGGRGTAATTTTTDQGLGGFLGDLFGGNAQSSTAAAPQGGFPGGTPPQGGFPGGGGGGPGGGSGPFGAGFAGPLRLFGDGLADQWSWLVPLGLLGGVVGVFTLRRRRPFDRRGQALLLWGGWGLTYGVVYSMAAGIFHTYYLIMMAPAAAALAGIGLTALWRTYRRGGAWALLLPAGLVLTAAWQAGILAGFPAWGVWLAPIILGVALFAGIVLVVLRLGTVRAWRRLAPALVTAGLLALAVAPGLWSLSPVLAAGNGGMPQATAPQIGTLGATSSRGGFGGFGGFGPGGDGGTADSGLISYLEANQNGAYYLVAVSSANEASSIALATRQAGARHGRLQRHRPGDDRREAAAADRDQSGAVHPGRRHVRGAHVGAEQLHRGRRLRLRRHDRRPRLRRLRRPRRRRRHALSVRRAVAPGRATTGAALPAPAEACEMSAIPSGARGARLTHPAAPAPGVPVRPLPAGAPAAAVPGEVALGRRLRDWKTLAGFALSALIVLLFVRGAHLDLAAIWATMRTAEPGYLIVALLTYYAAFVLRGLRWQLLLRQADLGPAARPPSLWALIEMTCLAWFVNCLVPAKLGDGYRAYLLRKHHGADLGATFGTVVGDRMADVLALVVLLLASGLLIVGRLLGGDGDLWEIPLIGGALLVAIVAGVAVLRFGGPRLAARLPARRQAAFLRFVAGLMRTFQRDVQVPLYALTAAIWGGEVLRLWLVLQSFHITGLGPGVIIFTALAGSLLSTIPFTPAGLGAVEGATVAILGAFGLAATLGGAVAVVDRVINYWSNIPVGAVLYLVSRRK